MDDTIDGYWDKPLFKTRTTALVVAFLGFVICIGSLHDAYEVRGKDRPFFLKIVGMPQL
jgi:hypothetical protein